MQYFIANCIFICSFLTKRFFVPYFYILILGLRFGKMFCICLYHALAVSVIPVVGHESVVVRGQQTVLLVPFQFAFMGFLVCCSIFLRASRVDVHEVSVRVILVGVAVACLPALVRSGFRAVVNVADIGKLELLSFLLSVGVRKVVAHVERAVELQVVLREVLALRRDAVHVVVAHCQCVACRPRPCRCRWHLTGGTARRRCRRGSSARQPCRSVAGLRRL